MNYIVLLKQVPDIRNIPKDAWDWEKGTLKRGLLENVCNELDKQALALALRMKSEQSGIIVALTMGPPFADEVLRFAFSLGVDKSILVTDAKFAGADTAATAYPLAQAIRKIEREVFNNSKDYIILSGMQSVDGDTAQVPSQIAEELGIVNISYVTDYSFKKQKLFARRITKKGIETISPLNYPCLLTVVEWTELPYATFNGTRWAYSQSIDQWNVEDINADKARIGLAGSRTNVVKIFSPKEHDKKKCVFINDVNQLVKMVKNTYDQKVSAVSREFSDEIPYKVIPGKELTYCGDIWVYVEHDGVEISPSTFELLGKASELAAILKEKVCAVLVGSNINHFCKDLIAYGADKVFVVDNQILKQFFPVSYTNTISSLVKEYKPQIMLFSATPEGRELAPRIAYRTNSGLTADCTKLDITDFKRGSKEYFGIMLQTRPALGGNIMASIISQNSKVQMCTARPGVMTALQPDSSRVGEIIDADHHAVEINPGAKIVSTELFTCASELKDAKIIISGGKGLKTKECFDRLMNPLVKSFEKYFGQSTMAAGSRLAVDAGFINRDYQVGQTGQTVKPKLYVAIGISGAVQHLTGMQGSDIIVAINKDPNARIFKVADFGIIGDLEIIIPQLIDALNIQESQ